jgi:hypothetical protein
MHTPLYLRRERVRFRSRKKDRAYRRRRSRPVLVVDLRRLLLRPWGGEKLDDLLAHEATGVENGVAGVVRDDVLRLHVLLQPRLHPVAHLVLPRVHARGVPVRRDDRVHNALLPEELHPHRVPDHPAAVHLDGAELGEPVPLVVHVVQALLHVRDLGADAHEGVAVVHLRGG